MWKGYNFFINEEMPLQQIPVSQHLPDDQFVIDDVKLMDVPMLQHILKQLYDGRSPWSYTIFLLELSRKDNGRYLKISFEGVVVGFIGIRIERADAHITNIAITPTFQGRGLGTLLLKKAEEYARNNDCISLSLEVKRSNKGAIRLYQRLGFEIKGLKKEYYKEDLEDALDMIYWLGE
ncbi:ribosomal protein S18-alanine N-acetyltransferase [Vagococcus sp.]|uniref:ribosomal protein S18-alanine N-acetyltransferase n=1 Tax=Vagococcus sp. TaxID=1933889 RepID=UPI003F94A949